jgi:hypothetical protein
MSKTQNMATAIEKKDISKITIIINQIIKDPEMNIESSKCGGLKDTPKVIVNYLRN